jgi:hypothetical protein
MTVKCFINPIHAEKCWPRTITTQEPKLKSCPTRNETNATQPEAGYAYDVKNARHGRPSATRKRPDPTRNVGSTTDEHVEWNECEWNEWNGYEWNGNGNGNGNGSRVWRRFWRLLVLVLELNCLINMRKNNFSEHSGRRFI